MALLERLARQVRPVHPRPVILMYHRVAKLSLDPWALSVSPKNFGAQMAALRRERNVLAMDDFVACMRARTLPNDAVAITFDDGYVDNLMYAEPMLAHHGLRATLFLTTGNWLRGRMLWWDELARLILEYRGSLRETVLIGGASVTLAWSADSLPRFERRAWRGWDPPKNARQRAFVEVWSLLKALHETERVAAMGVLRGRLGSVHTDEDVTMSERQIAELLRNGVFELGGHTESHASLPVLAEAQRALEISSCFQKCEQLAGKPAAGFAYPYGDLDAPTRDSVARSGFQWACTTREEAVQDHDDVFALPRIAVPDVGARAFLRAIAC